MASPSLSFRPLCGSGEDAALCYLLDIAGYRLLLDCGWDDSFDVATLKNLKEWAADVDAVLVTFPDIPHIGALPYAYGHLGLTAPTYGTIPVREMGRFFLYDAFLSRTAYEDFAVFSLDDVDAFYDRFHPLKYSQRFRLPGSSIDIIPYCAGHMIGGTAWRIAIETTEIVYAVDIHHSKERHLSAFVPSALPPSPSLLITDARHSSSVTTSANRTGGGGGGAAGGGVREGFVGSVSKSERDTAFLDRVIETLRRGGNVLIPSDTAGRVLEILLVLEQHWAANRLGCYGIGLLTKTSYNSCRFASSQLEWMNEHVVKTFDMGRENIFSLRHIKMCDSIEDLASLPSPMVVLASSSTLTYGFSLHLFAEWCSNPLNLVLLTDRTTYPADTFAQKLLARSSSAIHQHISLRMFSRERLEGRELEEYLKKREAEIEAKREKEEEERRRKEEEEEEKEAELPSDPFTEVVNPYFTSSYDLFARDVKPFDPFPMFPFSEATQKFDAFGEVLPEGYLETNEQGIKRQQNIWGMAEGMGRRAALLHEQETKEKEKEEVAVAAEAPPEIPTKCVAKSRHLEVKCFVDYVNFEGRSDARSKKNILRQIAPRKLILVHASEEEVRQFTVFANTELRCSGIYSPRANEAITLDADTQIHKIQIRNDLWDSLRFIHTSPYDIAYVRGVVAADGKRKRISECDSNERMKGDEAEEADGGGGTHVLTPCDSSKTGEGVERDDGDTEWEPDPVTLHQLKRRKTQHTPIYIGDVGLKDLRKAAEEGGVSASLQSGVLTYGPIRVRKQTERMEERGQERWVVEGPLCEQYFAVRDLLLQRYQAV